MSTSFDAGILAVSNYHHSHILSRATAEHRVRLLFMLQVVHIREWARSSGPSSLWAVLHKLPNSWLCTLPLYVIVRHALREKLTRLVTRWVPLSPC